MAITGDYVEYTNVKKGLYIDFSDQCHGLQIADICAGIFTASLKYESAIERDKHKYQFGHDLFFSEAYRQTRSASFQPPYYNVYKIGVKEVPNGAGTEIAQKISVEIADRLERDFIRQFQ